MMLSQQFFLINKLHLFQVYMAHISCWDASVSVWEPYSKINDLQLEFTMLDPHIRTALPPMPKSPGKYAVTFRAPDRHGVFKFVINHRRKGFVFTFKFTFTLPLIVILITDGRT